MDTTPAPTFRGKYGPWAVVAGASAGLGAEFARQLAASGLHLVLVARRAPELEALAATLRQPYRVETQTIALDLAAEDAAETLDHLTSDKDVGLLIYNATNAPVGPFLELSLDEHMRELAVNVRAPMTLAWRFGQRFAARRRGGIILMSSMSATMGSALVSNYAATKAFTLVLAEGLWEELRERGVDVLAVQPAVISAPSPATGGAASGATERNAASATSTTPEVVAREALAGLGRGPAVVPGAGVKLAAFFMRRVLPRTSAIRMMGRVMRQMYGADDAASR